MDTEKYLLFKRNRSDIILPKLYEFKDNIKEMGIS